MKAFVYRWAKLCGLFAVTRWLFRKKLLILCYHGFEVDDESGFMPGVFMRPQTFRARMKALADGGYAVLPLEEALARLHCGTLPDNAVCLTLDDGFASVRDLGAPILREFGFPSMLYATTYYSAKAAPVFRLVVQYMFWKSTRRQLRIDPPLAGIRGEFDLTRAGRVEALCWDIIACGERDCGESERQQICRRLGELLDVDYQALVDSRMFGLLSPQELAEVDAAGMDVQLHTHRHQLPADDPGAVRSEILENRALLERWLDKRCTHFCYPSGQWAGPHLQWLRALSISSATTCDKGRNDRRTHPLALYRTVDSEAMSALDFEAELTGFSELLRIISGRRRKHETASSEGRPAAPVALGDEPVPAERAQRTADTFEDAKGKTVEET